MTVGQTNQRRTAQQDGPKTSRWFRSRKMATRNKACVDFLVPEKVRTRHLHIDTQFMSIQGLFRVYSGSIQGLFRVYSGSIQGLFRVYSGLVGSIRSRLSLLCSRIRNLVAVQGADRTYNHTHTHTQVMKWWEESDEVIHTLNTHEHTLNTH
jgi:hypothetical protein